MVRALRPGVVMCIPLVASRELEKELVALRTRISRYDASIATIQAELDRPGFTQQAPLSFQLMTR